MRAAVVVQAESLHHDGALGEHQTRSTFALTLTLSRRGGDRTPT
jgi:hypothetical protein